MRLKLTSGASACLGPGGFLCFWISMQNVNFVSGWECGEGFAPCCSQMWDRWTLQCVWTNTSSSTRDNTSPPRLTLALYMILTINARRFQKTQRIFIWECLTLRSPVNQNQ